MTKNNAMVITDFIFILLISNTEFKITLLCRGLVWLDFFFLISFKEQDKRILEKEKLRMNP